MEFARIRDRRVEEFGDGEGRGKGGDKGGTFTAAAAWPGGLRSVERFAAVGEAGEEGEG